VIVAGTVEVLVDDDAVFVEVNALPIIKLLVGDLLLTSKGERFAFRQEIAKANSIMGNKILLRLIVIITVKTFLFCN